MALKYLNIYIKINIVCFEDRDINIDYISLAVVYCCLFV